MDIRSITQNFEKNLKEEGKSIYTIIAYKTDIEQFLKFCEEKRRKKINGIDKEDIKAFMNYQKEKGYTMKSISRKLNSIKTFFRYAIEIKLIELNPSLEVQHPKFESKMPRILTIQEYRALRDTCRDDIRLYAIVELLLQTGMKIGELCRLELDDIIYDSKGNISALKIKKYESTPERIVPLNEVAINALKKYLESRPKIEGKNSIFLTKRGNPLLIRNVRFYLEKAFEKAGIENATVNDLRNTFIAHHLARGTSLLTISKIVGHKRISTTERYINLLNLQNDPKLNKLEAL